MKIESVSHATWDFIESCCPPVIREKWQRLGYPKIKIGDNMRTAIYLPRTETYYVCLEHYE